MGNNEEIKKYLQQIMKGVEGLSSAAINNMNKAMENASQEDLLKVAPQIPEITKNMENLKGAFAEIDQIIKKL